MATEHKLCDACETVEHCRQHGCIPLVPVTLFMRLPAPRQAATKYDPRMNLIESEKGKFTLLIDGLSMREIKDIFEIKYGSLIWSMGIAYPGDEVKLQFASADFSARDAINKAGAA